MQLNKAIQPRYVATDIDEKSTPPDAARFIKGVRFSGGRNANTNTGSGGSIPAGSNMLALASVPGTSAACNLPDQPGYNKVIGAGEFEEVNKIFYCVYNSLGNHAIYMVDSITLVCSTVITDQELNFSNDPQHAVPEHRMALKIVWDSDDELSRKPKEMYLLIVDGKNWQRYINVLAAIKTGGFNVALFPYWKVFAPHFDRAELIDYPTRPPMFCPSIAEVPVVSADRGKENKLLDSSVQFAYAFLLTDGRRTTLSPWSLPFTLASQGCDINKLNLTRCLDLTLYAGSPMVERILIYRRFCNNDWTLYDTIDKYSSCNENSPDIIKGEYWKRVNGWADYSYNPTTNTIKYRYCGDKGCSQFAQEDALRIQNDIPIVTWAMAAVADSVVLANNKYFYNPIPCETTKNLQIGITPGAPDSVCPAVNRKISLYSMIARDGSLNNFAFHNGNEDEVFFGGAELTIDILNDPHWNVSIKMDEVNLFRMNFGENDGFIMYLAGTPYFSIGRQYKVDRNGNKEFIGVIDASIPSQLDLVEAIFSEGGYFIMQYDFVVPAGKYIARLARHNVSVSTDYPSTSTWVAGLFNSISRGINPNPNFSIADLASPDKEIEVDVCTKDFDIWRAGDDLFYILAPIIFREGLNERWRFIEGYVKEDKDSTLGVELLTYAATEGFPSDYRGGSYTDHNGHYFSYTARGDAKKANVRFTESRCTEGMTSFDTAGLPSNQRGYFPDTNVYVADKFSDGFGGHNRMIVRGTITKCGTATGISGVAITLTRGMTTYTASDGTFELIVHRDSTGDGFKNREDRIYINAVGTCIFLGCSCECTPVINYSDVGLTCDDDPDIETEYPVAIDYQFKISVANEKTLKGGGTYDIGVVGWDLAGRGTLVGLVKTINYPTFIERGNFVPSILGWQLTGPLKLDKDIRYVSFARTDNLSFGPPLQWVGDKIEWLDINGEVITSTAGAVRAKVTIQSLNDYNIANKFSSTTTYQFVAGDKVRFYDDGNNNMFSLDANDGFLDYPILGTDFDNAVPTDDGKSFIIPFDRRLEQLKDKCGFWIELIRPRDCQLSNFFYEICGMYPVRDGELMNGVTGGTLNTWDTYYLRRSFKIDGCSGKIYGHPFESANISDFYGQNCSSNGRQLVRDDKVIQRWYPDDFIKSDDFVNEGGYNGLGTFRDKNRKQFKGQEAGGIVALHAERNIIFCVSQNNWHLLDYNINTLRVNNTGVVVANLDQTLSDPHQKVGSNYGCAYEDTSTILFFNGLATWANVGNNGWIVSDYQSAKMISDIDNKNYFAEKFNYIKKFNNALPDSKRLSHMWEKIAGVDLGSNDLYVTFRPRRGNSIKPEDFVNEQRETIIPHQETFIFNFDMKKWSRWSGAVPEYYSVLRNAPNGASMLMFAGGKPHFYDSDAAPYNTYFGIKTEMVVQLVYSDNESKVKIYQGIAIESNQIKWFVDEGSTDDINSMTYVPSSLVEFKEGVWYAPMMANMNSYPDVNQLGRSMLHDGKRTFGQFLKIRIVGDPSRIGEYCELQNVLVRTVTSEKSDK